ncbi:MAG: Fur family transcriptional regulator [Acidimicrobiales bacterium]|jgi:Fur family ferric uptake transcriptional regulator
MVQRAPTAEEILSTVRGSDRRVTLAKRTVVEVLVKARGHLTAEEITSAVQSLRPEVSPSTVYRILEEFEELNIVVHSHLGQAAAVYHLAGAVHGHLTCEYCKQTIEISAAHFDALSKELQKAYGFQLDRHHVALSGTCARCRDNQRAAR